MAVQTLTRYILSVLMYLILLPVSSVAAFVVPLYTRAQYSADRKYTWGGWFGTYDNPPQGDVGFVTKRAPFPNCTWGFRGYVNRVAWMRRNRLYGLKRKLAIDFKFGTVKVLTGNTTVSDKYKVPGALRAECFSAGQPYAFEYYKVWPWGTSRCVRVRLGWKVKGDKFTGAGDFAPLVFTFNPFDTYG
jgi:hypothetical protein